MISKSFVAGVLTLLAICANALPNEKRAGTAFFPPNQNGGSELDVAGVGVGEPMNVIISALSSPEVLTDAGFLNYAQSLSFSFECLDIHLGAPQSADLGDGNGQVNQTTELRFDFGNEELGTCLETLEGGNHLRVFRQNGSEHNTGALFLAVSMEEDLEEGHTIVPNGYNIGRDEFVGNATAGTTTANGVSYTATSETITGLLPSGSAGVNHGIAQDGIVQLLTVTIV
ncbi:hypothetical protein SCHPADRAFT_935269 [Schizopora paradoxa]|uniref:Uncharacterized protein n=1 Tax=Schizopora paradoxa TaxID=27342 RepID=A0A0H2S5G6_9AGAM|nr:hypothetical protein SCHPADRAFT_935269 [Schizopora paradoxa]